MQIEYTEIDQEMTPLGLLVLRRYEAETGEIGYEILLDGGFLMASHGAHSEAAMANLAYQRLDYPRNGLRILVGGLGAGHTLRAALNLPGVEHVTVAEIGQKVVEWNRRYFSVVNGGAVNDPRVAIRIAPAQQVLEENQQAFDLLLLDVDNGPGWLAAPANAPLYESAGLRSAQAALRPGGVMAVWSPQPNPLFEQALAQVFPGFERIDTAALGRPLGEPGDTIYLGVVSTSIASRGTF